MDLPTIKVQAKNEQGFIIINECDLNETHSLFDDKKPTQKAKEVSKAKDSSVKQAVKEPSK